MNINRDKMKIPINLCVETSELLDACLAYMYFDSPIYELFQQVINFLEKEYDERT